MATKTEVDVAIYMERLDSYIQSQTELNKTLSAGFNRLDEEIEEIKHWRTKIYGAKAALITVGVLLIHSAIVLGSFVGIMTWLENN